MSATPEAVRPKRILVLGGSGMLGTDTVRCFSDKGWSVRSPGPVELDLTSAAALEKLRKHDWGDFDWVVNCAAYTDVDKAEGSIMAAMAVNAVAPGALAAVCQSNGWRLLHVSTDFVFDGQADTPYREDSVTNPLGIYGKSKLMGEHNAIKECPGTVIVRTSWLFGPNGRSFPRTMIEAWLAEKPLRVVNDQFGNPTYTVDLARAMAEVIEIGPAGGILHATGPDTTNWHGFAVDAIEAFRSAKGSDRPVEVQEIATDDWPTLAKRPPYSVLDCTKIFGIGVAPMRPTQEALAEFSQRLRLVGSATG